MVEAAPGLGISTLTLYAFSADNWRRPVAETSALMALLESYLRLEAAPLAGKGVRLSVIGRRDRLPLPAHAAIRLAEKATAKRTAPAPPDRDRLLGARGHPPRRGARRRPGARPRERFARLLGFADHAVDPAPDVDLLIRTGGEQRLSDFLLWESAYAELLFTDVAVARLFRRPPGPGACRVPPAPAEVRRPSRARGTRGPGERLMTERRMASLILFCGAGLGVLGDQLLDGSGPGLNLTLLLSALAGVGSLPGAPYAARRGAQAGRSPPGA